MSDTSLPPEATPSVEEEPQCSFDGCELHSLSTCKRCNLLYCLDHASEIDPMMFCVNCAIPSDITITEKPLVDKDGVTHQGRVLIPTGPLYVITSKLINEMDDEELNRFIIYNQQAIHEAENLVDYRKIRQATAEGVAFDRKVVKRLKEEKQPDGSIKRTIEFRIPKQQEKKQAKPKVNKVEAIMGALKGLSPEMLKGMIDTLQKKKVG